MSYIQVRKEQPVNRPEAQAQHIIEQFLISPYIVFPLLCFRTRVYGVNLSFLSRRKLFCRFRAPGLDDAPPELLPPGLDEPPPRPPPAFLFSLIMSSRDMFILSAILKRFTLRIAENTQRISAVERLITGCFLWWRCDVEPAGNT